MRMPSSARRFINVLEHPPTGRESEHYPMRIEPGVWRAVRLCHPARWISGIVGLSERGGTGCPLPLRCSGRRPDSSASTLHRRIACGGRRPSRSRMPTAASGTRRGSSKHGRCVCDEFWIRAGFTAGSHRPCARSLKAGRERVPHGQSCRRTGRLNASKRRLPAGQDRRPLARIPERPKATLILKLNKVERRPRWKAANCMLATLPIP